MLNILQIRDHSKILNAAARESAVNHMCKCVTVLFSPALLPFHPEEKPESPDDRSRDKPAPTTAPVQTPAALTSFHEHPRNSALASSPSLSTWCSKVLLQHHLLTLFKKSISSHSPLLCSTFPTLPLFLQHSLY